MIFSLGLILVSIVLLYLGAEWLVKGSSAIALRMGITPLVVGLTVVAFGTSSPELVVSINATLSGQGTIAVGNVVGSNILNICLILGLSAVVYPLRVKMQLLKLDMPILIVVSLLIFPFFMDTRISRFEGVILFAGIVTYTVYNILLSRKEKNSRVLTEFEDIMPPTTKPWFVNVGFIVAGLVFLILGSSALVEGSVEIARYFGLSEAIIGLTIIAGGTSMPELATSLVAAIKKEPDIAIGNVVGSSIFNLMGILGTAAIVKPISTAGIGWIDLGVMTFSTLILLPLMRTEYSIGRGEGVFLVLIYGFYLYYIWP